MLYKLIFNTVTKIGCLIMIDKGLTKYPSIRMEIMGESLRPGSEKVIDGLVY